VDVKAKWPELMRHPMMTYSLVPVTQYHVPEAETFNLLGANGETSNVVIIRLHESQYYI
jgi:hypothetical protein